MSLRDPCSDCGHCCSYFRISFPWVETSSYAQKPVPIALVSQLTPERVCMKGTEQGNGRCVALNDAGRCTIYEQRPSVCRDFSIWNADGSVNEGCTKVRKAHGLVPHAPLHESAYAQEDPEQLQAYLAPKA